MAIIEINLIYFYLFRKNRILLFVIRKSIVAQFTGILIDENDDFLMTKINNSKDYIEYIVLTIKTIMKIK